MDVPAKDIRDQERRAILNKYRGLLRDSPHASGKEERRMIRKAFLMASEAHQGTRRKSGEPYIFHPIAVARIVAKDIGLGTASIVSALLHDTVEDTKVQLKDIRREFGDKVANIIKGLTKIDTVSEINSTQQAENFRKILLTLSDDVRVILIKIADRLHNMQTLQHMKKEKQWQIASETSFLYAPLAHRFGLYAIKSELEDLALKYKEPELYQKIERKLKKTKEVRNRFIRHFSHPIRQKLSEEGFEYQIQGRTKSINSIYQKIQKKQVSFEEIYDLFAIRIVIHPDKGTPPEDEKALCWRVYSIVTDFYTPNPDRLRDWISTPKANGYESLHTTVMSPTGKWVEVQIRTGRMDEIAERGYAAHYKYKGQKETDKGIEQWMGRVREILHNPNANALEFMDNLRLDLFSDEIHVFTPKGEPRTLPKGATALDLAFDIHTQVGEHCMGARVNRQLVPLNFQLRNGDQVEIIKSRNQTPKQEWIDYVATAKARSKIKSALKKEQKRIAAEGKEKLKRKFRHLKVGFTGANVNELVKFFNVATAHEMYLQIANNQLDLGKLKELKIKGKRLIHEEKQKPGKTPAPAKQKSPEKEKKKDQTLIIGKDMDDVAYKLAPCCNPIPGDDVFGFSTVSDGIKVHRVNCPNANELLSHHAERVIRVRWSDQEMVESRVALQISGIDNIGVVNQITEIISDQLNVNMNKISFESTAGYFEGRMIVNVLDTKHLDQMTDKLQNLEGVQNVERIQVRDP